MFSAYEANKGKSNAEIGLKEFKEVEIRPVVMDVDVTITQRHISKLMYVANEGRSIQNTKDGSKYSTLMKEDLFDKSNDFGKVKNMKIL